MAGLLKVSVPIVTSTLAVNPAASKEAGVTTGVEACVEIPVKDKVSV
jgi:hypothetical protein